MSDNVVPAALPLDEPLLDNLPEPPTFPEAISMHEATAHLQRRYTDMLAMYTAGARLDVTREERDLYHEILATAIHLTRTHSGSLMLLDDASGILYIAEGHNLSTAIIAATRVRVGDGVAGWVAAQQHPLLLNGPIVEAQYPNSFPKPDYIGSSICVPLLTHDAESDKRCMGVLNLSRSVQSPALSNEDLQLIRAFCANAANIIHNARVCKTMKQRTRHLEHLLDINRNLTSSLNVNQVLRSVMTTAVELLQCEAGSLLLKDEETNELVFKVVVGPASKKLRGMRLPMGVGIVGSVAREGKALIVNDAKSDPRHTDEIDDQTSFQTVSLLCVPLIAKGRTIGVLEVMNKTDHTPFHEDDCEALTSLAIQSAIALENATLYSEWRQALTDTVRVIANAVEARDPYTAGHTGRVTAIALEMAHELNWPRERIEILEIGALLHDIGKIGIADMILHKPESLTTDEYTEMQQHPVVGAQMLKGVTALRPAMPCILFHQERYDGKGYPFGFAGEEIPVEGRLLAVADTFDAMTSDRPYRKALSIERAIEEITLYRGTQFDPEMVDALLGAYQRGRLKTPRQSNAREE